MQTWTNTSICLLAALLLSGCSTTKLANLRKGAESAQIYAHGAGHENAEKELAAQRYMLKDLRSTPDISVREAPRHEAYSRSTLNEIEQLFPKLENPTITVYVYPHLSGQEQAPVPGYTTAFSLYDRDHYALPSELPSNHPEHAYRRTLELDTSPAYLEIDKAYVRSGAYEE